MPQIDEISENMAIDGGAVAADPDGAVKKMAEGRRAWFENALEMDANAVDICHSYSETIDLLVRELYQRSEGRAGNIAVLALGGYGRREMGLGSDIDLLFLRDGATEDSVRRVTDGILYPFWNAGIDAGGATRDFRDCMSVMDTDPRALTAMTEARFLCGDESLFLELNKIIGQYFSSEKRRRRYVELKVRERNERIRKFGDSIYLLEPNVKEGEGGLRDFHTLIWTNFAVEPGCRMDFDLPPDLKAAVEFLWRVRHTLHLAEGRRVDRLSDAVQPEIAKRLKFAGGENLSAAEALMSAYYENAATIRNYCERGIEKALHSVRQRGRLAKAFFSRKIGDSFLKTEYGTLNVIPSRFGGGPIETLELFAESAERCLPVDCEAKEIILKKNALLDDAVRSDPRAGKCWRAIFSAPSCAARVLSEMHECGVLLKWFPEMGPMFHRVQHDGYHSYTAGTHSIRAVEDISKMQLPALISRPYLLVVATFFHDLGKGRGGNHAAVGAELAAGILKRLGFRDRDIEDASFLIRSHLLMSRLGFRRDIHDPALVERFAQTIRSPEILTMLYLLTLADLKAVGPQVLNDWKAGLLSELYHAALAALVSPDSFSDRQNLGIEKKRKSVRKYLSADVSNDDLSSFLAKLPERYLLQTDAETIAAHLLLGRELSSHPVATANRPIPEQSRNEFSVVTRDSPGLFARIAGILTANGINIIGASVYTNSDGLAIDVFWITDAVGLPVTDAEQWRQIREELSAVVLKEKDIESVVSHRFRRRFLSCAGRQRPTQVIIDNDVSAAESVIEIHADDRRGLLYTIASVLYELGLTIERARITTIVDRVIDVFYVKDVNGEKVVARDALDRIRDTLLGAIEE